MLAHLVLSSIIVSGLLMLCGIAINALASLWTRRTRIKPWSTPVVKVQDDQRLVVGPRSDSGGLSPQPTQGSRLGCSIFMLSEAWASLQARAFGRLGYHVARRPWCTLAAVFIFAMGMACGLLVMKKHKDALTMWLPSNAVATHHAAVYSALTKRPRPRSLLVLIESHAVTASTVSSNTSLKALLLEAMEIHSLVTSSGLSNVSAASAASALSPRSCAERVGGGVRATRSARAGSSAHSCCGATVRPPSRLTRILLPRFVLTWTV